MQSKATTVADYLAQLPADRRAEIQVVREVILRNLDKDYEEGMQYGMIGYYVPHRVYPAGYHCDPRQPVTFAGLASQKNHMSVYLMCVYGSEEQKRLFEEAWKRTGKKLDMGKSCIRFKKAEDLALDVLGETIRRVPARKYIEHFEAMLQSRVSGNPAVKQTSSKKASPAKKAAAKKSPPKKAIATVPTTTKGRSAKSPKKKAARSVR